MIFAEHSVKLIVVTHSGTEFQGLQLEDCVRKSLLVDIALSIESITKHGQNK